MLGFQLKWSWLMWWQFPIISGEFLKPRQRGWGGNIGWVQHQSLRLTGSTNLTTLAATAKWSCQLIGARRAPSSLSQAELLLSLSWCTLILVWMQWSGMCNDDVLVHVMEWDTCSLHWLLTSCDCQPSSPNVCVYIQSLTEQQSYTNHPILNLTCNLQAWQTTTTVSFCTVWNAEVSWILVVSCVL